MSDILMDNCLTVALLVVTCVIAGILICNATRRRKEIVAEAVTHSAKEVEQVDQATDELKTQSRKLKVGLRRIAGAHDPLQAFIDSVYEVNRRERRREEKDNHA
jgi:hypothetical protein